MSNQSAEVTVVGGGLAGMATAHELAKRGVSVTVLEASDRLGGKAGASVVDGSVEEHGYHIFPEWYENTWALIDELGIRGDFEGVSDFHQLRAGAHPRYRTFRNLPSPRYGLTNLTAGVEPIPETFLFLYATLDLLSQPYRRRAKLDQITINGFLRSRFYRTDAVADRFRDLILKGISVPTYEVSAMTMRNLMRYWFRTPEPMHSVLNADLQSGFIDPFERRLEDLGVSVETGRRVEGLVPDDGAIESISVRDESGEVREREVEALVLAVPAEAAAALVDDEVHEAAPSLSNLKYLEAQQMAALHVHFDRTLPGIPRDHVNLLDSTYGLSYIDVSQWWAESEETVLNVIASDYEGLVGLSEEAATASLLDDLREYLPPFDESDVRRTHLQPHEGEPLFKNGVGAWTYRPTAETDLENLYLAGDYCRTYADLVSMEGAITSGLHAADAAQADLGLGQPVRVREADTYPRLLLVACKWLLAPLALLARLFVETADRE